MIDKDNIPDKWVLELATNKEDSDLVSEYMCSIGASHYSDLERKIPMRYYPYVNNGEYKGDRNDSITAYPNYTVVTIEEFKKYILKLPEYNEEIIIFDEDSEMLINNQLLTIRNDEIIKIKKLK